MRSHLMHARRAVASLVLLWLLSPAPAIATEAARLLQQAIGDHSLVLLGEMHGTREIPAICGELVARYAKDETVLLALEANAGDQSRVERFLLSDGGVSAKADLLSGEHWQEMHHDGRDSAAMFALLEQVRQLRASGKEVDVVMFDDAGQADRDTRMAEAIRVAVTAHPGVRTLALMGNVHAMTGEPPVMLADGKPFVPPKTVGGHLADLSPLSIVVRANGGSFWTCMRGQCGERPVIPGAAATGALPRVEENGVGAAWRLTLLLPRFTASPPAIDGP